MTAKPPARPPAPPPLPEFPAEAIPELLAMAERAFEEVNKGKDPEALPRSED